MAGPRDADGCPSPRLWNVDFVQLSLDRWIQARIEVEPQLALEVPQMLLYHLAQVSLQSNMGVLHRLTQAAAQSRSPVQRNEALNDSVQPWASNLHYEIALWHARAILRIAKEGTVPPPGPRRHALKGSADRNKTLLVEPPHLPLCVYFATLVAWFGEVKSEGDVGASGDDLIGAGSQLLFRLRVPMAKFLGTALCELLSSENSDGETEIQSTANASTAEQAVDVGAECS